MSHSWYPLGTKIFSLPWKQHQQNHGPTRLRKLRSSAALPRHDRRPRHPIFTVVDWYDHYARLDRNFSAEIVGKTLVGCVAHDETPPPPPAVEVSCGGSFFPVCGGGGAVLVEEEELSSASRGRNMRTEVLRMKMGVVRFFTLWSNKGKEKSHGFVWKARS